MFTKKEENIEEEIVAEQVPDISDSYDELRKNIKEKSQKDDFSLSGRENKAKIKTDRNDNGNWKGKNS